MLSVAEAQQLVIQHARRRPATPISLSPQVLGLVLAEHIASDLDMPPYDKALMDGYAVRSEDLQTGDATLTVVEEVLAGHTPQKRLAVGQAARIMTGASMPTGADAVVMIERTEMLDGERVRIKDRPPRAGQNWLARGREMRTGETILPAGTVLRPQELGLLAAVGRTTLQAYRQPDVAILSTGDEIVDAGKAPGPGQIRNSNGPMLAGQVHRAGGTPLLPGIARDEIADLRSRVEAGLKADVLVLSGGVSAGKLDLVPGVLQEAGVEPIFHKISMKPGRPLFFGVKGDTLVFGLPGNPVSALVGFELFARPALRLMRGLQNAGTELLTATLGVDFPYNTDRATYHPARLELSSEGWRVTPVPWFGSPDLRAIAQANAFVLLPVGEHLHRAGARVHVLAPELG